MATWRQLWLLGSTLCLYLTGTKISAAQIIPDGTTANTAVVGECLASCEITGGTLAEQNLFHSFSEFNIGAGEKVYFADPGVTNIFSRVTGGNLSEIFGTLGVLGGANLFLLNPNGILFGTGASLDLNGSFVATTADGIEFGDRGFFSAIPNNEENSALLTVNPSAFFFNQMGQNNPITITETVLSVPETQNVTLLGGQSADSTSGIVLNGANIQAPRGRVELGAVKESGVIGIDSDFQLEFLDDVAKGDITLTRGSAIDVSGNGSGSIKLTGNNVTLTQESNLVANNLGDLDGEQIVLKTNNFYIDDNSFVSSNTIGKGDGADIIINAHESVKLSGRDSRIFQQFVTQSLAGERPSNTSSTTIFAVTGGSGAAGNIAIATQDLTVDNGAWIISATSGQGASGILEIDVARNLTLQGSGLLTGSNANSTGRVGKIDLNTKHLLVEKGAVISSSTLGEGNAGDLTIAASDSIWIQKTPLGSVIPNGIYTNTILGRGNGGDLTIDTQRLTIREGAQLSSSSGAVTIDGIIPFGGTGGNIEINASDSVDIRGVSPDGLFVSGILSDTRTNNSAGNLTINTGNLFLKGQATISASSIGNGDGGNIIINAANSIESIGLGVGSLEQIITDSLTGQLELANIQGSISTFSVAGQAGDITISSPQLNLEAGAIIASASFGSGDAGDLKIDSSEQVSISGSTIASPTFSDGNAGHIALNTKDLIISEGGSIATASLGGGDAGDLSVSATESVEISNAVSNIFFSGSISTGSYQGQGNSGNLTIDTQRLVLKDGASIQTNNTTIFSPESIAENPSAARETVAINNKKSLTINASESIEILGSSLSDNPFNQNPNSHISSTTSTGTPASNIRIDTGKLSILDGGDISVNSVGDGAAGSLSIVADAIYLESGGNLNATTVFGGGGNITLKANDLVQLSDRAEITTSNRSLGNGGNITINSEFVIALDRARITADAIAGDGGNIAITAEDLFIASDSLISASSKLGIDGEVNLKTFENSLRNDFTALPETIVEVDRSLVTQCSNSENFTTGTFTYTGRGGLPLNPLGDRIASETAIADFNLPERRATTFSPTSVRENKITMPTSAIVEARGWIVDAEGNIVLTAQAGKINSNLSNPPCPFFK